MIENIEEKFVDEELESLENSLRAGVPYENEYFMSVYTTCMDIIEDRVKDVELKKEILRPAVRALEYATKDGMFKVELLAISLLKDVPNLQGHKKLKKLATSRNTVLNALEKCAGMSFMKPRTFVGYLCSLLKGGFSELLLVELLSLQEEAKHADFTAQLALAYIDTQLDLNKLQLSGVEWEARNEFAKLVNKFDL